MNALIVEDDFIIQMFLEKIISNLGCEIIGLTDNSEEAFSILDKHSPDVILMDVSIEGEIDGIQMSQIIREKYQIPVIFITGNSDAATLKRINAMNPAHIIKKPIDEFMLMEDLQIVCNSLNPSITRD